MTGWGDRLVLALGWLGDFDGWDLASLALLSHGPAVSFVLFSSPIAAHAKYPGIFRLW